MVNKLVLLKDIINYITESVISVSGDINDIEITSISAPESKNINSLDWIDISKDDKKTIIYSLKSKVVICDPSLKEIDLENLGKTIIYVENPKLVIAQIAEHFFQEKYTPKIHQSAIIHEEAILGNNLFIGPNTYVGKSTIGDGTVILGNTYIDNNVTIGNNVFIQAGVIIGNEGHNYIKDDNNLNIKFPHLGGVIIKNNVEIGGNSFIARGVLSDTIINEETKIAQLVYIGANVEIGKGCAIRANAVILGSVKINDNVIIAPSSTIRNQKTIGANSLVGMGSIVTKDIPENEIWIGTPAKKIRHEN